MEYTLRNLFNLGPPAIELGGGSKMTTCGGGWLGRIYLGRFLLWPPSCQVSVTGNGQRGSSLKPAVGGGWLVGARHWDFIPRPPRDRRLWEDTDPETLTPPPYQSISATFTGGGASSKQKRFFHSVIHPILICNMVRWECRPP